MTVRVPSVTLDTALLPAEERFRVFSETLSATHEMSRIEGDSRPFLARATAWFLGDVVVTSGRMMACVFERSALRAQTDGVDHFTFVLLRSGQSTYDTSPETTADAGQVVCSDFTQGSRSVASDNDSVTVAIARTALTAALPRMPNLHHALLTGAAGRLVADHFLALAQYLPEMPAADGPVVAKATVALVAASLAHLPASAPEVERLSSARLRARVDRYIDAQLQSPTLSPERISAELSISRSSLYRAFRPRGGVIGHIHTRRLEALHMLLNDPRETRSISELAYAFGFMSYAHFSASFRRRFGFSPREVRSGATAVRNASKEDAGADVSSAYKAWMRSIGRDGAVLRTKGACASGFGDIAPFLDSTNP